MSDQYNALYQLYLCYLHMAAWDTPYYRDTDAADQAVFRSLVESKRLFEYVEDAKHAVLRSGIQVPDRWLWPICAATICEGRLLADETRDELGRVNTEISARLVRLHPDAKQKPPAPQLAVDILHDSADLKIKQIATDRTVGGNERMRNIIAIDARYAGKPSTWWAELLGVLDGTVRSYETWKAIQRQRKAAD